MSTARNQKEPGGSQKVKAESLRQIPKGRSKKTDSRRKNEILEAVKSHNSEGKW